jgi:ferredoxin
MKMGMVIDLEKCIGCRSCMVACPYGVRQFNWEDPAEAHKRSGYQDKYHYGYPEEHRHEGRLVYMPMRPKGIVEKCTFCAQYRDKGELPACVQGVQARPAIPSPSCRKKAPSPPFFICRPRPRRCNRVGKDERKYVVLRRCFPRRPGRLGLSAAARPDPYQYAESL